MVTCLSTFHVFRVFNSSLISCLNYRASGKQLTKREVKLQDKSGAAVSLTLWGNDAEKFDAGLTNPVIAVKAAKVSDFGGRSLSVSFNSTLLVSGYLFSLCLLQLYFTGKWLFVFSLCLLQLYYTG